MFSSHNEKQTAQGCERPGTGKKEHKVEGGSPLGLSTPGPTEPSLQYTLTHNANTTVLQSLYLNTGHLFFQVYLQYFIYAV